ncbi:LacI family transcriptional regulator [Rhodocytophaga rosea]|uniref:LacI family transcriptional regulator n=1 Tax=Rhodocytophaga rosea TaxID=2704465 RepID=A0A6C0GC37_9BACT|nr:LacI family DNA-binding transcriptional regulator [Rhodocytophaga rosea]QHT65506.1 LacI family transcriptional regulator [Rhodocytophaga rosea]
MKFEAVTIKDIARALGLSTSTVSRALRGSYEISADTKQLVLEYAEKMNYQPNPIAKSLKENRSWAIGVIVPEIANNFFSQTINGIDATAYKRGYHVVITQSHESVEREVANVHNLVARRVDGLLVSLSMQTSDIAHFKSLQERGLPIVFFDRISEDISTFKVKANNYKGAYLATRHLIETGCRRIAHLTTASCLSITRERLEGYKAALSDCHIDYHEDYVKYFNDQSDVEQVATDLISMPEKPDAIFSASDRLTTACIAAIQKAGLQVPDDIALVGFTNLHVAEFLNPALTAVTQPAYEMGQIATELLIKLIESKKPIDTFETRILDTTLVIRASSGKKSLPQLL